MKKNSFPLFLLNLILFIAIANALATEFSWYWRIPWFDMPMHFLGGLWVSSTTIWLLLFSGKFNIKNKYKFIPFIYGLSIASVVIIGGAWELFELGVNIVVISVLQNSFVDTASDMTFNILGALTAASYFVLKNNKKI